MPFPKKIEKKVLIEFYDQLFDEKYGPLPRALYVDRIVECVHSGNFALASILINQTCILKTQDQTLLTIEILFNQFLNIYLIAPSQHLIGSINFLLQNYRMSSSTFISGIQHAISYLDSDLFDVVYDNFSTQFPGREKIGIAFLTNYELCMYIAIAHDFKYAIKKLIKNDVSFLKVFENYDLNLKFAYIQYSFLEVGRFLIKPFKILIK